MEEYAFFLGDVESNLVVVPEEGNPSAEAAAATLNIPVVVASHDGKGHVSLTPKTHVDAWNSGEYHASVENISLFTLILNNTTAQAVAATPVDPEDVAMFLHTSGTTSRPKGVPLTHKNMVTTLSNIVNHYSLGPSDCTFLVMVSNFS